MLYEKVGTHPLIQEYNKHYHICKDLENQIKQAKDALPIPEPRWETRVIRTEVGVRIRQTLLNKDEFEVPMKLFGESFFNTPRDRRVSVEYIRTSEGILTHTGGGWLFIAEVPTYISDNEWAQMLEGNIPERLWSSSERTVN